jgi:UDP-GlcNAc:undecaprenyl-phosphate GlcNAc-1-phosphate transferase
MFIRLLHFGATLLLSLGLGLYLTPIVRNAAVHFGILDMPDGELKRQPKPVPYLGGIAVYLAFLISLCIVFELRVQLLGLLLGSTMMAMLGLFDDLHVIAPRLKLAGQLLAAWVLIRSGISIQIASLPDWLPVPLTIAWLVGITNAVNILDVSDGLASGVSAIAALGLFVVAVLNGDLLIATTTLALVGSLTGFLRYNQPPARIYLGDTGSLFVGFMLAALAMIGAYARRNELAVLAPIAILIVPVLDTTLVTLARLARGESPFRGSPDHLAIRLKQRGWSARRVAWFAYGLGIAGSAGSITMVLAPHWMAVLTAGLLLLLFAAVLLWLWFACPPPLPAPDRHQ